MHLLQYFVHYRSNGAKALPLAQELTNSPTYAGEAWYWVGWSHQNAGKCEEAIKAFQQSQYSMPAPKFRIAECHVKLGKLQAAVAELQEIENFFKDHAPEARWRMAQYYKDAGNQKQHIANLRGLMKLYPKSSQASAAHEELEKLGVKIGGGVDAD
jgi:TolA-binding protein